MSVRATRVPVATTATKLGYEGRGSVLVRNRGNNPIYLGGPDVQTTSGFQVDAGESATIDLVGGEVLYGIVASSTETAHVLQQGV